MKKKIFGTLGRLFVLGFVAVLFVVLPSVTVFGDDNISLVLKAFTRGKCEYQGIIEVWNIDEFESGTAAKSNYLNTIARTFEKQNRGAYILVRNLTEYECLTLLASGESPDLFSCSYKLARQIEDFVQTFSSSAADFDVMENILDAGIYNGELYAVPWCMGAYVLLSTTANLERAGVTLEAGKSLSSVALTSYFETETKKGMVVTNSLTFGANGYLLTETIFKAYIDSGTELDFGLEVDTDSHTQSCYDAYVNFISGGSTVLLGTQRDVARLEGRLASGKISDLLFEFVSSSTDLVQFCMVARSDNNIKTKVTENFVKMLTSKTSQKKISNIGMLCVTSGVNPYETGSIMSDITLQISSDFKVFKIFE